MLAKADPSAPDNVPIDVTVVESQSRRIGFGIGYSTDSGLRGQVNYTDHDFLNEKLKFTANASVDKLTQEAGVGLSWPTEPSGWHWDSGLKFKHEDIQDLDTTSYSVTGARIHATEEHETALSLQYLEEHQELEDGTKANNHALFLNQSWAFNRLDNVLAPREGYAVKLQLGGATELLLSDQNFVRTTAKFQYLRPVFKFGTLLLRAEAGVVFAESTTGIPTDYLFRTGGDTTVRGYAFNSHFNSLGVQQGGSAVSGRYLGVASAEYIHWITKTWGAAIFYDIGNAADEVKLLKPLAAGYGVGVRWSSPVGALNLDIAHGTIAPEPWRIHFFAGISFQ